MAGLFLFLGLFSVVSSGRPESRNFGCLSATVYICERPNAIMEDTSSAAFQEFWHRFSSVVKRHDYAGFKAMSLSEVKQQQNTIATTSFIKNTFAKLFDKDLVSKFSDTAKVSFIDVDVEDGYFDATVSKKLNNPHLVKEVSITKIDKYPEGPVIVVLKFVETKAGYKFFGYDVFGGVIK